MNHRFDVGPGSCSEYPQGVLSFLMSHIVLCYLGSRVGLLHPRLVLRLYSARSAVAPIVAPSSPIPSAAVFSAAVSFSDAFTATALASVWPQISGSDRPFVNRIDFISSRYSLGYFIIYLKFLLELNLL